MRHAILQITPEMIAEIMKGLHTEFSGIFHIVNGLPKDAKVVDCGLSEKITYSDNYPHDILIKLESKEFEDITHGNKLPIIKPPTIETLRRR